MGRGNAPRRVRVSASGRENLELLKQRNPRYEPLPMYEGPVPARVFSVESNDYDCHEVFAVLPDETEANKLKDELNARFRARYPDHIAGQEEWEVVPLWLFPTAAEALVKDGVDFPRPDDDWRFEDEPETTSAEGPSDADAATP